MLMKYDGDHTNKFLNSIFRFSPFYKMKIGNLVELTSATSESERST